jgi:hypothetical protein
MNCFADDTGLEIEALNGEPGVYSARYAGEEKDNEKNIDLVLKKMDCNSKNYAVYTRWFLANLSYFESKNLDLAFNHLFKNYIESNQCKTFSDGEIAAFRNKYETNKLFPYNKKTPEIYKNAITIYLKKLSKKYCKNGKIHIFNYDDKHQFRCQNCSYVKDTESNLNEKALLDMYKSISKNILDSNIYIEKVINKVKNRDNEYIQSIKKVYEKIVYKFKKNDNNIDTTLTTFLDNIQKLLGLDILIDKNVHNLYDNIYIIDHDINGSTIEKPVQVYDNDKKFRIVYNQPHYKRDVLIHTVQKNTKYEVFYDLYKRYLIGYREINKEYVNIEKINCKIKVVYSIKNIFLMYGFTRQYINIKDMYPDLYGFNIDKVKEFTSKDDFKVNLINNIFHRRFSLIKKLCNNININVYILYR